MIDLTCVTASFSIVATIFVVWNYVSKRHKVLSSSILALAVRLILSDGIFSAVLLLWKVAADSKNNTDTKVLDAYCRVFHPILIFLLVAGYGWTVAIALKFRGIPQRIAALHSNHNSNAVYWIIWIVSFVLVLPIIILNALGPEYSVSTVSFLSIEFGLLYCFFAENFRSKLVNNLCFQLPLLLTIAINLTAYTRGIYAISNAPHSTNEPGGLVFFALLIIWIPNFAINLTLEIADLDTHSRLACDGVIVLLTSSQGLLNCVVYIYRDRTFRRWLRGEGAQSHSLYSSYSLIQGENDDREDEDIDSNDHDSSRQFLSTLLPMAGLNTDGEMEICDGKTTGKQESDPTLVPPAVMARSSGHLVSSNPASISAPSKQASNHSNPGGVSASALRNDWFSSGRKKTNTPATQKDDERYVRFGRKEVFVIPTPQATDLDEETGKKTRRSSNNISGEAITQTIVGSTTSVGKQSSSALNLAPTLTLTPNVDARAVVERGEPSSSSSSSFLLESSPLHRVDS